jgi:hypothetical protein
MSRLAWIWASIACLGLACNHGHGQAAADCTSVCQSLSDCAAAMNVTMAELVGAPAGSVTLESCAAQCGSSLGGQTAALACLSDLRCTAATTLPEAQQAVVACQDAGVDLPDCPATDAIVTVSPLADADIAALIPLGNLNPSGHVFPTEHQYFYLPLAGPVTENVPVVSPGHLFVTKIASSEHLSESPVYTDWDLTLAACAGLSFKFGHVTSLSSGLAAVVVAADGSCSEHSTGGKTFRSCSYSVRVELQPGDPVGTAGGNPGQYALDLGTHDLRKPPVALVNPGAYGDAAYARCILDYATSGVRSALVSHIARTAQPICGTQGQDVAGTAQGNWRRAGFETYPEDPHLALVHDPVDPAKIAISMGTSLSPATPGVYSPTNPGTGKANRDPSEVVPGSPWCWDLSSGVRLVVDLPGVDRLRAQAQSAACGAGPWSFSGSPVEFVR